MEDNPIMADEDATIQSVAESVERVLPEIALRLFTMEPEHPLASLPQSQVKVCVLLQSQKRTVSQISLTLGISASAVTQVADRLEKAGLVERLDGASTCGDRRTRYLQLTPYGAELMQSRREWRVGRVSAALERLAEAERVQFLSSIDAFLAACRELENPKAADA